MCTVNKHTNWKKSSKGSQTKCKFLYRPNECRQLPTFFVDFGLQNSLFIPRYYQYVQPRCTHTHTHITGEVMSHTEPQWLQVLISTFNGCTGQVPITVPLITVVHKTVLSCHSQCVHQTFTQFPKEKETCTLFNKEKKGDAKGAKLSVSSHIPTQSTTTQVCAHLIIIQVLLYNLGICCMSSVKCAFCNTLEGYLLMKHWPTEFHIK